MIFVTVGYQMPFDRMVALVDQWAGEHPEIQLFAQIGESDYRPKHLEFTQLLSRRDFDRWLQRCTSVVAHAGTGTIIQVLLQHKPLLVFPRLSHFAETRNDHQVGTARHFAAKGQLMAAFEDQELLRMLTEVQHFQPRDELGKSASPELIARIQRFLAEH